MFNCIVTVSWPTMSCSDDDLINLDPFKWCKDGGGAEEPRACRQSTFSSAGYLNDNLGAFGSAAVTELSTITEYNTAKQSGDLTYSNIRNRISHCGYLTTIIVHIIGCSGQWLNPLRPEVYIIICRPEVRISCQLCRFITLQSLNPDIWRKYWLWFLAFWDFWMF